MANPSHNIRPGPSTLAVKSETRDNLGVGDIRKNPTNISLVVANICKYLSLEDLKVCRTLNQQWKEESEKFFWKSWPPLTLSNVDSKWNRVISIFKFMEVFHDPHHSNPNAAILRRCRNFEVQWYGSEEKEHDQTFDDFLTNIGPQMTSLEFSDYSDCWDSTRVYDILTTKYTKKLESLCFTNLAITKPFTVPTMNLKNFPFNRTAQTQNKSLRKLVFQFSVDTDRINITLPWLDVLSQYPNLKTLELTGYTENHFKEIATALLTLRQDDVKKFNVTELEWQWYEYNEPDVALSWGRTLKTLEAANLPLKHLKLDTIHNQEAFASFLQAQSGTLKSLVLKDACPHPFPLLEYLEEFETDFNHDFRFLPQMPNLKSLKSKFRRDTCIFPTGISVPNEFLTVFQSDCLREWSVPELDQLLPLLPNIQILEIRLNNNTFSSVCQNLIHLKELTVFGELDDSAVIGEIMRMEDGVEVMESSHGITNLRELERFVMVDHNSRLTEKSVFQGFSLMTSLSYLEISVAKTLSLAAQLSLTTRIQTVRVKSRRGLYFMFNAAINF